MASAEPSSHRAGNKRKSGYSSDNSDFDLSSNESNYNSESDDCLPEFVIAQPESSSQSTQTVQPTGPPPSTPTKPCLGEHGAESMTAVPGLPATPTLVLRASQSAGSASQSSTAVSNLRVNVALGGASTATSVALGAASTATSELSPLKLVAHHQKPVDESKKLLRKVRKLSKAIVEKTEVDRQISKLKQEGGIRAMAVKWEEDEALLEEDKNSDTQPANGSDLPCSSSSLPPRGSIRSTTSICSNAEPPPLPTRPPGKAVFANPPSFITELYPPFIDVGKEEEEGGGGSVLAQVISRQLLMQESPDALRMMISGRWLEQCYKYPTMWQWLFQITSRSSDPLLSNRAFQCLIQLLQAASQRNDLGSVRPPALADVMDVLVCLGVDQTRLLPCDEGMEVSEGHAVECDDVFHSPKSLVGNVKNVVKYLTACIRLLPKFYSQEELESLINLLLNVSLDPLFCGAFAEADANVHIAQCVGEAITAFPEESWMKVARRLTSQALGISSHHHNRLHLVTVVGSALRPRQGMLQKMLCRESIARTLGFNVKSEEWTPSSDLPVVRVKTEDGGEMDFPEAEVKSKNASSVKLDDDADCSFAHRVVLHYYKQRSESYDYYSIYSVMTMLSLLMHPSEMKWPTNEERKQFGMLLGALSSEKIRDNAMRPERMPVKDLIIRMKLEVNSHKTVEPRQTSIDSYLS